MSRKDYELIAGVLKNEFETALAMDEPHGAVAIQGVAEALARKLALDNPRFDKSRFMLAAVNGDGPVGLKALLSF